MRALVLTLFLFAHFAAAAADFKTPWLSGPVIDEMQVLQPSQLSEISELIRKIRDNDGPQLQVFITQSLQDMPIEKVSIDIVNQWKIGDAKRDDGLLFLIAPNERKVRIEVGQGLEGVIPDIYAKRINEDIVVPLFKQGEIGEGVHRGVIAIVSLLQNEGLAKIDELSVKKKEKAEAPAWLIVLFWILLIFLSRTGLLPILLAGGGRGGGGFGSSGGGWSGGGGGFSGGGSSSSW